MTAMLDWFNRGGWKFAITFFPYAWLLIFFLAPFALILGISFSEADISIPPFKTPSNFAELKDMAAYNYGLLIEDNLYWQGYLNAVKLAGISTLLCLLVGYPMAYAIAQASASWRNILLLMVILPFWTSLLLRTYAWIGLLNKQGLINDMLVGIGLTDQPIQLMNTDLAVYIGITYSYLPFMILPLFANLERLDGTLREAAMDLGAKPWRTFIDVTLPLSVPGILAGSLLVFIPATGEYVIPRLLGRADSPMIGKVLFDEFFLNRDWPVASAVAVVLLIALVVPMMLFNHTQAKNAEGGH